MNVIPPPTFSPPSQEKENILGPPEALAPLPGHETHLHPSLVAGVPVASWNFFRLLLAGDSHAARRGVQRVALENLELFTPRFNVPLATQRDLALKRLKKLCGAGLFSVYDFDRAPRRLLTMHECCGMLDASLATKFTVQFNLFGGTLLRLGSKENHVQREVLTKIDSLQEIGCFALTELGYGNNAVCLETTATYDPKREEFLINCPTTLSQKYWITNGALHASWAIVFAQLIIRGASHGVHAFLVRIRQRSGILGSDGELRVCPGVKIEDMGHRIGCNGVDNAKITFTNVRVPRSHLLDSITKVEPDGSLFSVVEDPDSHSPDLQQFLKNHKHSTATAKNTSKEFSSVSSSAGDARKANMTDRKPRRGIREHASSHEEMRSAGMAGTGSRQREISRSKGHEKEAGGRAAPGGAGEQRQGPVVSSVSTARNRFLLQTEQLLSGRLCIASMMMGGIKIVLTNTFHYSSSRLSTGPSGLSDTPILSFAVQKQTLVPLLAQALVLMAWTNEVKALYERFSRIITQTASVRQAFLMEKIALFAARTQQSQLANEEGLPAGSAESRTSSSRWGSAEDRGTRAEERDENIRNRNRHKQAQKPQFPFLIGSMPVRGLLEAHASAHFEVLLHCCALKPTVAWCAERIATEGRERCGGGGFLSANLFGEFIGAAHAGLTAEGDNRVLYAKVSKEIFTRSLQHNSPAWLRALTEPLPTWFHSAFAARRSAQPSSAEGQRNQSARSPSFSPLFSVHLDTHLPILPPPTEPSFPPPLECGPGGGSTSGSSSYPPPLYGPEGELLTHVHVLLRHRITRKIQRLKELLQRKQMKKMCQHGAPGMQARVNENDGPASKRGSCSSAHTAKMDSRMQKKKVVYDLWMADLDTHDLIYSSSPASIAKCFADLAAFEAYLRLLGHMMQHEHELCAQALEAPLCLFGLSCLENDLGFFVGEEFIKPQEVPLLHRAKNDCVERVAEISMELIRCFGIPDKLLFAPIAGDWAAYNNICEPKHGELLPWGDRR